MNKIKKKTVTFLLCLVAGLSLTGFAACNQDGASAQNEPVVWDLQTVYAKAQDLGYAGSLEEFLATIQGKDGVDGKDGQNGKDGVDGKDGQDGKDGVGIENIYVDENGHLIVKLTGKDESDLGQIVCDECLENMSREEELARQETLYAKFKTAYDNSAAYDGAMTIVENIVNKTENVTSTSNQTQEGNTTITTTISFDPNRRIGYTTATRNTLDKQNNVVTNNYSTNEASKIHNTGEQFVLYNSYEEQIGTSIQKREKQNKIFQDSVSGVFTAWQQQFDWGLIGEWDERIYPETLTRLNDAYQSVATEVVGIKVSSQSVEAVGVEFFLEEKDGTLIFTKKIEMEIDLQYISPTQTGKLIVIESFAVENDKIVGYSYSVSGVSGDEGSEIKINNLNSYECRRSYEFDQDGYDQIDVTTDEPLGEAERWNTLTLVYKDIAYTETVFTRKLLSVNMGAFHVEEWYVDEECTKSASLLSAEELASVSTLYTDKTGWSDEYELEDGYGVTNKYYEYKHTTKEKFKSDANISERDRILLNMCGGVKTEYVLKNANGGGLASSSKIYEFENGEGMTVYVNGVETDGTSITVEPGNVYYIETVITVDKMQSERLLSYFCGHS